MASLPNNWRDYVAENPDHGRHSTYSMAKAFGVSRKTIVHWSNLDSEFKEFLEKERTVEKINHNVPLMDRIEDLIVMHDSKAETNLNIPVADLVFILKQVKAEIEVLRAERRNFLSMINRAQYRPSQQTTAGGGQRNQRFTVSGAPDA